MTFPSTLGFTEIAYQEYSGGPCYYKSDYPGYSDDLEYVTAKGDPPRYTNWPDIVLTGTFYPGQMGISDPAVIELPHCEYCGRKQAKEDEPLCPGCGNVV